jgi:hypothetical protein
MVDFDHSDDGPFGKLLFQIVVSWVAFCQSALVADD